MVSSCEQCILFLMTHKFSLYKEYGEREYATDWQMCGSIPGTGKAVFSSPEHPDSFWSPPSLLFNGYWGIFPWQSSSRGVNLTTQVARFWMNAALPLPSWHTQGQLYLSLCCYTGCNFVFFYINDGRKEHQRPRFPWNKHSGNYLYGSLGRIVGKYFPRHIFKTSPYVDVPL